MRVVSASSIQITVDLADFYTVPAPYTQPAYILQFNPMHLYLYLFLLETSCQSQIMEQIQQVC